MVDKIITNGLLFVNFIYWLSHIMLAKFAMTTVVLFLLIKLLSFGQFAAVVSGRRLLPLILRNLFTPA